MNRSPGSPSAVYLFFLVAAAVYPAMLVTLQLFASCALPLAVRLLLVYAGIFSFLRALTFDIGTTIDGWTVIAATGICLGGFVQQLRGWTALPWGQEAKPRGRISIATLLDLTAAMAITMGIASTTDINPSGVVYLLLGWLVMMLVGMHGWGRLTSLCDGRMERDMGFAIWMSGSAIWGCCVFLLIVMSGGGSPKALLAFVIGPLIVLISQLTTQAPIYWLRACGWRFARAERTESSSGEILNRAQVEFLNLGIESQRVVDVADTQQTAGEQKQDARKDLTHVDPVDPKDSQEHVQ
jgi:hypothetical protein